MDKDHLIACHCKDTHEDLFLAKTDNTVIPLKELSRVEYIDINCDQTEKSTKKSWNLVDANSKDFIWTIGCPIYSISNSLTSKTIHTLLTEGWRVLRNNGKVIIPLPSVLKVDEYIENIKGINAEIQNNWSFDVQTVNNLGYYIKKNKDSNLLSAKNNVLVITKPALGGRRKRSSTLKRKTKRRKHIRKH